MRELTKQEKKLFKSWFNGFAVGFREAYDKVPANTGQAWSKLALFRRAKLKKTEFNHGYNKAHELYLNVIGKPWDEINPEIYKEWYKRYFLYHHVYKE